MTKAKSSLVMSLLLLLLSSVALAQTTSSSSSVTGVVTDPTGAVIAGATVTLTDTKTSKDLTTTTDDQGVYRFSQVPPGQGYKLTFSGAGFQTLVLSDVALGVGTAETHNVQLTAGQVTETVEVTASNEATLNTTDASIGNVIETRRLVDLPVQIRNSPAALIGLQPGVVGNNVGTARGNAVGSVTGSRADQGNITVDGIDANDQTTQQFGVTIGNAPIDSVQEFRAVTANPGASEGRSSGGQIQLITKSGTNEFHGSLREFNRTAATSANTFFNNRSGVKRPQLTRNQFGGSIGGPVYMPGFGEGTDAFWSGKDKLFFFFDYEGRRDAQGVSYLRVVPLPHYRQGSVAFLNNTAGCPTNARLNTRPECITILSPAQVAALDPRGVGANQALLNLINERYPLPNDLTAGNGINTGGFRFNSPSHRADNTYTTRIDWNATERQRVFGRFNIARRLNTDTVNTVAQQFPQDPETGQIQIEDTTMALGHTWTASASVVNDFRFGLSRGVAKFPAPFAPTFPNIFGTPAPTTGGTFGGIGIAAPFADISYQDRDVPVPTFRDDLSWNKGTHSIQFGGQFKPIHQKSSLINDFNFVQLGLGGNLTGLNGTLRPSNIGAGTTRSANYDNAFTFLLGRYASINTNYNYDPEGNPGAPGTGKSRDYKYNEYEIYGQDSWRIRNDLTITYGLRWQFYPAPYEVNGFQAVSDVPYQTLLDTRIHNAALGIAGNSAEPFLTYDLGGQGNNGRPLYESDKNNFAPRLSFAYNPSFRDGFLGALFGDRKMVLRGGGSLVYDRVGGAVTFIQDQVSYLFDNSASTAFGTTNARNSLLNDPRFTGINALPIQNVAPEVTRPFTPFVDNGVPFGNEGTGQTNYAVDPNFKIPYSIQYSFGFQRELPANFIMELAYVGRQGRKLFTQADAAQILNFKDANSGQFMFSALNTLQAQINSGATVTNQPWFENQISQAIGGSCNALLGQSCTTFVADNLGDLVSIGDTADIIQVLQGNGFLRPNVGLSGQFSTNAYITNLGSSSYNGMLFSLRRRFSQGLQFDVNYTWSHAIDNQSSITNTVFGGLVCDVTNLRVCRGDADFDIRHIANVNGIWEIPIGRGKAFGGDAPGWLNAIIGGWQISGIYSYRSGLPFSTTTGAFPVGFVFNSPAVFTGANSAAARGDIRNVGNTIQYFADPDAVLAANVNPQHGQIGNRNIFRGPSFWNLDTAVLKNFRMPWSENHRLQIRWESYNAFNHNSFGLPAANINGTTFGQITSSASAAREMQFAVRYDF